MTNTDTKSHCIQLLASAGIRLSLQRIAILQYLLEHHTHPTAAEIYDALHEQYPSLSRTTVYNTLRTLVENGAIAQLDIDPGFARFDANLAPHAHFLCRSCGRVHDIDLSASPSTPLPAGFHIDSQSILYRGLCPQCSALSN